MEETTDSRVQALSDQLALTYKNFFESGRALNLYIIESHQQLTVGLMKKADLLRKFDNFEDDLPSSPEDQSGVQRSYSEDEFNFLKRLIEKGNIVSQKHPSMLFEMGLIYLVALIDAFLQDILQAVCVFDPQLFSKEKIPSTDELLSRAEKEVNKQGRESIAKRVVYYETMFGFTLADSQVVVDDLVVIFAKRDLIVHSKGVVNQKYLQLVSSATEKLGDKVVVDSDLWKDASSKLTKVATFVYNKVSTSFGATHSKMGINIMDLI